MKTKPGVMVISNMEIGDVIFGGDEAVWNVTRAWRDCEAGKHRLYVFEVAPALEHTSNVEVDEDKVERYSKVPEIMASPLLIAMEDGMAWLIDGHHRLRAMARVGVKDFIAYVIDEKDIAPYRVWFNGKRVPPFKT
jgi:hypothetical protein